MSGTILPRHLEYLHSIHRYAMLPLNLSGDDPIVRSAVASAEGAISARLAERMPSATLGSDLLPNAPLEGLARSADVSARVAAITSAHLIRLRASEPVADLLDAYKDTWLPREGIDSRPAAIDLRRDMNAYLPAGSRDKEQIQRLCAWILATGGAQRSSAAGYLARIALGLFAPKSAGYAAVAYMSAAAPKLLPALQPQRDSGPLDDDEKRRIQSPVRAAVRSGMWTKKQIAEWAGISRPTLDAWTAPRER